MSISFDRAVSYYDATRGYRAEVAAAVGRAIMSAAAALPSTQFLEIGAGTGRIGLPLAALGCDYTGIDISAAMLDRFRAKLAEQAHQTGKPQQVRLLEADAAALPFADGSFDVVIATHVFHLVGDPQRTWAEARRVLRPGGLLLVCSDSTAAGEEQTASERWSAIVREESGDDLRSSSAVGQLVRDELERDPRLKVDELRPVQWQQSLTVRDEIEGIRQRLWSNTWQLSDDVFSRSLDRLTAWADTRYGGMMDRTLSRASEFVIRRIQFPEDD